jgi:exodeoxyribonuclease VII small subunit
MASFEEQLKGLEAIVAKLESGDLSLEDSVRLFEEGMKLSDGCKKELEAAEGKIQMLVEKRGGGMKVVDFEGREGR